jgi:hypothetical protein
MNPPICPVLSASDASLKDFVAFWKQFYSYDKGGKDFYQENRPLPLTDAQIAKWFEWKNGRRLASKKAESIRRYFKPTERIRGDADEETLRRFLNKPGGAIWRIFWLHLQHQHFPIYDQHAHRAMAFMLNSNNITIPVYNPAKVEVYLKDYCRFFDRFNGIEPREVDKALWSFGRFLNSDFSRIVVAKLI